MQKMAREEGSKAATKWMFSQMTPLLQQFFMKLENKDIFFGRDLKKQNVDQTLIAMDAYLSRTMGSAAPRMFNVDPHNPEAGGWIKLRAMDGDEHLSGQFIETAARSSLSAQRNYLIKGKGSPYKDYGHYQLAGDSDGMNYWWFQNVIGPAILRDIPVVGSLIAAKTGRVGTHYRELDQYDVGTYLMGKQAVNQLLRMFYLGAGASFDDLLEETKDLPIEERKQRFIDTTIRVNNEHLCGSQVMKITSHPMRLAFYSTTTSGTRTHLQRLEWPGLETSRRCPGKQRNLRLSKCWRITFAS